MAGKPGPERATDPNHKRMLGLALAYTDAAHSIVRHCTELIRDYSIEAMEGGRTFDDERTFRLYGQFMTAHKLCWEAGDMVFRAGSTTGARDGARLQRMWRDLCAFRTNGVHQLDFNAPSIAQARFGAPTSRLRTGRRGAAALGGAGTDEATRAADAAWSSSERSE